MKEEQRAGQSQQPERVEFGPNTKVAAKSKPQATETRKTTKKEKKSRDALQDVPQVAAPSKFAPNSKHAKPKMAMETPVSKKEAKEERGLGNRALKLIGLGANSRAKKDKKKRQPQ
ncbi:hypothetical protein CC80DRAFT_505654 [Byssothecium circinans]|uniref:Uncharacterized protein n=1 Tax=Byssothecium circinans TaxID=147558 RepID=A0A6A5U2A4_9PLEO|nr:hypothetical protein CC80DRAFT_505654 [Byssothecium circinans]